MVTSYNSQDFSRNAFKVMVDIDPNELNKNSFKIDLPIHSDALNFLELLNKEEISLPNLDKSWLTTCQSLRNKYPIVDSEKSKKTKYINSYVFIETLSDLSLENSSIVTDMGLSFVGTHQSFHIKSIKQKLFTNSGHAPMGWGLPASIGACFANNKKRVICLSGDGGLQMNIQELSTIMHHKLPIILFIFNNFGYLTIKQTQESGLGGRIMGADKKSGLSFPNYSKISKSYGIKFFQLDSNKMLEPKLKQILKYQGPVICELVMSPSQPQVPKLLNRRTKDGKFAIPTSFEDLYPYLSIEEINKNLFTDKNS